MQASDRSEALLELFLETLRQTHEHYKARNPKSHETGLPQTVEELKQAFIVYRTFMNRTRALPHDAFQGISPYNAYMHAVDRERNMVTMENKQLKYLDTFFRVKVKGKLVSHLNETLLEDILTVTVHTDIKDIEIEDPQQVFAKMSSSSAYSFRYSDMPVLLLGHKVTVEFEITNNLSTNVELCNVTCSPRKSANCNFKFAPQITARSTQTVKMDFIPSNVGQCRLMLSFDMRASTPKYIRGFSIQKWVSLRVIDPQLKEIVTELKPKQKFQRKTPIIVEKSVNTQVIRGEKPASLGRIMKPLDKYDIDDNFKNKVEQYELEECRTDPAKYFAKGVLRPTNYGKYFHACLNLEEMQMQIDIRFYDIEDAKFVVSADRKQLILDVPGLSEKRPSVLYGDRIFAKKRNDKSKTEYEGWVHKVEAERIFVRFHGAFHKNFISGVQHNVRFTFSRSLLKRAHRGIDILASHADRFEPWIFPNQEVAQIKSVDYKGVLGSRILNDKQRKAVKAVASRVHGQVPFMIFGPPGTGKTTSLVEAMIAYSKVNQGKILVMAPSNNAADYLCYKLASVFPPSQMFRIHAFQRGLETMTFSDVINKYSMINSEGHFCLPADLKKYRVIVSTCASASYAWDAGLDAESNQGKPYFDAIFVDEAGHANEADFWSSISCFVEGMDFNRYPLPSLIVAGDPRQLGPIIRSPIAMRMKFDMSYMERLIDTCDLYNEGEDGFDERFVVKLTNNYRSHPDILSMYSNLFYGGELVSCSDPVSANAFVGFEELSNPKIPIQFHGVVGCDEREGTSPSWMNLDELQLVMQWISKILASKGRGISPQSIGVITPYRKQVQKLRLALKKNPLYDGIMVGTCEEFQGQEKSVIIISTVRSNINYLKSDLKFNLGFLFNQKRFNVGISRAKSLIIAIGNPHVLTKDFCWKYFLDYCRKNGCVIGEKPPLNLDPYVDDDKENNDVLQKDERPYEIEWEFIK